jgi:hypothetical protein
MNKRLRQHRGITLIMVAAVLAVLAAIVTGFHAITIMQTRSAMRYSDSVRAEMAARAGIHDGLARLREAALKQTETPSDPWYMVNYLKGAKSRISYAADFSKNNRDDDGDGKIDNPEEREMSFTNVLGDSAGLNSDRYQLQISDAASKININAGDNLAVILDNLCRVIGPPLACADQDALQPRRWFIEGAAPGLYDNTLNTDDKPANTNLYYWLYDPSGAISWDGMKKLGLGRPKTKADGTSVYGDGYAIAGYRARYGRFFNLEDIKAALTYVERNGNDIADHPLEQLEVEVKFAALRNYITVDSWTDTTTVCVGKFEWVNDPNTSGVFDVAIDRDKSWVADDPIKDPNNVRGSLRGSYVSIMNGHGAGQFRKIKTNGTDWIQIEKGFVVAPGPISSYMIIGKPDCLPDPYDPTSSIAPDKLAFTPEGLLKDDPKIDYKLHPLCIHRAPVNINTASDKVLAAVFMGLNVQHGHPMSIGTDVNREKLVPASLKAPPAAATDADWKTAEYLNRGMEPYLLTLKGLKRVPADSGKLVFDRSIAPFKAQLPTPTYDIAYLNNYGLLDPKGDPNMMNEAHELAIRIISARQRKIDPSSGLPVASDIDPLNGYERGPFRSWDDFYFRIVKPWDDSPDRLADPKKISVARMIMANFNSNTDLLKFNPNIEWIDRWGRNFTEMEPVMIFDPGANEPFWQPYLPTKDGMWNGPLVSAGKQQGAYYTRSMRYKSEELIDKSDLNRSTTEFNFDSGGIYEITSIGQIEQRGHVLAERKLQVLISVYDVWRESTQEQFVRGVISVAQNGDPAVRAWSGDQGNYSGKIARDGVNGVGGPAQRLALDTLPEPLVPLNYRLNNPNGITDLVDPGASQGRDAWGVAKTAGVPDIVANRVLPAAYDGQIVLATNTASYDTGGADSNTFLASFNGDLDTDTSAGNGREQAKTPPNRNYRVLDTIGLLGRLDDEEIDFDPKEPGPKNAIYDIFVVTSTNKVMRALDKNSYWENVTCRAGDLRNDGVFLGSVGVSGKDATIKYLVKQNWPIATSKAGTVCMWMKPNWHCTDGQEHEFFNANGLGDGFSTRGNYFRKDGKFSGVMRAAAGGTGGGGYGINDIFMHTEDKADMDMIAGLHGGIRGVPSNVRESPSYRTQPFRWSMTGMCFGYKISEQFWPWATPTHDDSNDDRGRWDDGGGSDPRANDVIKNIFHPFIDTARRPEGANFSPEYHWMKTNRQIMDVTDIGVTASITQEAAWPWADGGTTNQWIFGANNLNKAPDRWLYRSSPVDGTQAVIDELKLSSVKWDTNRIGKEMTTSRYYLPQDPTLRVQCPTFTSQTLLQSMKGCDKTKSDEEVTVARVTWTCFMPRFLHENKVFQNARKRVEMVGDRGAGSKATPISYKGPFDYIQYNLDILPIKSATDARLGEPDLAGNEPVTMTVGKDTVPLLNAERPASRFYFPKQPHYTKGFEVELVRDANGVGGDAEDALIQRFDDPDALNAVGTPAAPVKIKTSQLRYRVRFRYPIDPLVAKVYSETADTVDPARQYLLDTPVFDDISITYFRKPRILAYREISE